MNIYQVTITVLALLIRLLATCKAHHHYHTHHHHHTSNTALNRRYQKIIEDSMDVTANPCEDFFQYACGKWEENHRDPANTHNEMLSMTDYEVNQELASCFSEMNLSDQPSFVRKAYEYYQSCISIQQFDHFAYKTWMQTHENLKWLKISAPYSTNVQYDWVRTLGVMRRYGMNGIFIEEMMIHRKNDRSQIIVDLDKPVEGGGFVSLTYENVKDLMQYLNVPYTTKAFEKLWHTISEFEKRLEELDAIEDEEGSKLIMVKDLPFPWLYKYLATVLNQPTLDPQMELYIQNVPYMGALYDLLKKFDDHFICRYLEVRFLWSLQQNGPKKFNAIDCVESTRTLMPLAMHWLYEQQHPQIHDYTPSIQHIFDNIIRHFNKTLHANQMQFNQTILQHLLIKLDNIQLKIGNLPRVDTINVLDEFYSSLYLNSSDFYENHLKLLRFFFKAGHTSIPNTLTTNLNHFFNLEIYGEGCRSSPYFLPRANIIMVPCSSLRQPLYDPEYEKVYAYSSLGSTLAHEIFHGFDRVGLSVDFNGKMNSWQFRNVLSNPTFKTRYNCLRDLYPDVVDEKIADISGLRYAYDTFFSHFPDAGEQTRRIKDTDMSLRKLFFLNFAQLFCDSNISDVEHGRVNDRINDALQHFTEFSKTFGCSRQSRMLAEQNCQLWY